MTRKHDARGRSRYDDSPHYRLHLWLTKTAAWKALTGAEKAVYCDLALRYQGPGKNNGRIPYSVREAALCARIGKSTAARHLLRLQELGFIVAAENSSFDWKAQRATKWRLTEFACDVTGALASKEFARWTPGRSYVQEKVQNTVPSQVHIVPVAGRLTQKSAVG